MHPTRDTTAFKYLHLVGGRVMPGIRQLSLMSMRKSLLIIIVMCSLVTGVSAHRQKRHRAGALVNASKPAVYISFLRTAGLEPLRTGYGRKHLLFRITNNSRWAIWLEMGGVPKEYGDANLFYTIEEEKKGEIQIDSRCHVCSVNPVGAGRSVVFSIPADYATQDTRLRIEYSFAWERGNEAEGGSYSEHSVVFYFSHLPKSVLPATALSNNGMHPTPPQHASHAR
jgi:hypothetical protein